MFTIIGLRDLIKKANPGAKVCMSGNALGSISEVRSSAIHGMRACFSALRKATHFSSVGKATHHSLFFFSFFFHVDAFLRTMALEFPHAFVFGKRNFVASSLCNFILPTHNVAYPAAHPGLWFANFPVKSTDGINNEEAAARTLRIFDRVSANESGWIIRHDFSRVSP